MLMRGVVCAMFFETCRGTIPDNYPITVRSKAGGNNIAVSYKVTVGSSS
jgi:hypothetical protein